MNRSQNSITTNIRHAEAIFSSLMPDARDYIIKEREFGFVPEIRKADDIIPPAADVLLVMSQHPFVRWLRGKEAFRTAKNRVIKGQLVIPRDGLEPTT